MKCMWPPCVEDYETEHLTNITVSDLLAFLKHFNSMSANLRILIDFYDIFIKSSS